MRGVIAAFAVLAAAAPAAAQRPPIEPSPLRVRGFTDFRYAVSGGDVREGFRIGATFGRIEYAFGRQWSAVGELGVVARPDGFEPELGRITLRREFGPDFGISAGRFRTPIGYWNEAFPPGAWRRTPIDPPAFLARGTALLPVYSLGLLAEGIIEARRLRLDYAAGVANGRDDDIARPADAGDADGHAAWMVALEARSASVGGIRVGASLYGDRPAVAAAGDVPAPEDVSVAERIVALHVAGGDEAPEFMAEYMRIGHETLPTGSMHTSSTYSVQLAYRLPGAARDLKPYARLEAAHVAAEDPLFLDPALDYSAGVVGVRYDFMWAGALKAEYRSERRGTADRFHALRLQLALTVPAPPEPAPPVVAVPPPPPRRAVAVSRPPPDTTTKADTATKAAPEPTPAARPRAEREVERPEPIAIVVHPATPVSDVTLPQLRRIFRGEQRSWPGDQRIVLLVRPPLPTERSVVLGRIYQMDEDEFRQFWLSKIFRETAMSGPKRVSDIEMARALLASLPGAISFMPAREVGTDLRVLRVDGKLPGEDGYPLQ
ncbi:MAG TPA: hypothetical protein VF188_00030 [Longimicrobiales bacterium]